MKKTRTPGAGRKESKPDYDAAALLQEQMESVVALYEGDNSLQSIADTLSLNPIKVRKLLITAGVYDSDVAEKVQDTFEEYRETQDYKTSILSTASALQLSKSSVTSYLPYEKGVYFSSRTSSEKISVGAERQRRMRQREKVVKDLQENHDEQHLWECIVAFQGYKFKTISGLPFSYQLKTGRHGELTKELWIDRRENSKSLAWSSVRMAFERTEGKPIVDRPKALGDIRGVSYIYGVFLRFGLIARGS